MVCRICNSLQAHKCAQVFINEGRFALQLILHDKPWMRQRHNLAKQFVLLIQLSQKFVVLTLAEAKGNITLQAPCKLLSEVFYSKRNNPFCQHFIVVIVEVLAAFCEPKQTYRVKIKPAIKLFGSAKCGYHVINKNGRQFLLFLPVVGNATNGFKPYRVGKRNARYAAAKPTGVNACDTIAGLVVVVIFVVKSGNSLLCFRFCKWVHDFNAIGQFHIEVDIEKEGGYFVGEQGFFYKIER